MRAAGCSWCSLYWVLCSTRFAVCTMSRWTLVRWSSPPLFLWTASRWPMMKRGRCIMSCLHLHDSMRMYSFCFNAATDNDGWGCWKCPDINTLIMIWLLDRWDLVGWLAHNAQLSNAGDLNGNWSSELAPHCNWKSGDCYWLAMDLETETVTFACNVLLLLNLWSRASPSINRLLSNTYNYPLGNQSAGAFRWIKSRIVWPRNFTKNAKCLFGLEEVQ